VARDGRTHRITQALSRAALRGLEGSGVEVVDLRPLFHADLDAASSSALFVDHVHPTAPGHAEIAAALLPGARDALGL